MSRREDLQGGDWEGAQHTPSLLEGGNQVQCVEALGLTLLGLQLGGKAFKSLSNIEQGGKPLKLNPPKLVVCAETCYGCQVCGSVFA